MDIKQLNTIGSGAYFPIQLSPIKTRVLVDGKLEEVTTYSWQILQGDIKLIKQNLTSLISYQLGFRFRQENFGTRLWECIEEPSTPVLETLVKDFLVESISSWEPRIKAVGVNVNRNQDKLSIGIRFSVNGGQSIEELNFEYNQQNITQYVY